MNYKNSENENETLNADDARVRALLGALNRIDAPADFDFRLKARIERAKPNDYSRAPRTLPQVLRYVLPLGLVILVSAFVVFNGVYFRSAQSVAPIAETRFEKLPTVNDSQNSGATPAQAAIENNFLPTEKTVASVSRSIQTTDKIKQSAANSSAVAAKLDRKQKPKNSAEKSVDEQAFGSSDKALRNVKIITPSGINLNRAAQIAPNIENGKPLTAKEILFQLGIDAVFKEEIWRVKSVVQNSLAERSGVRAGDAVEAVDGERLTDKPLKNKKVEGKNLTVARGSQKIEILLTNKSN